MKLRLCSQDLHVFNGFSHLALINPSYHSLLFSLLELIYDLMTVQNGSKGQVQTLSGWLMTAQHWTILRLPV